MPIHGPTSGGSVGGSTGVSGGNLPSGNAAGDMYRYDGSDWQIVRRLENLDEQYERFTLSGLASSIGSGGSYSTGQRNLPGAMRSLLAKGFDNPDMVLEITANVTVDAVADVSLTNNDGTTTLQTIAVNFTSGNNVRRRVVFQSIPEQYRIEVSGTSGTATLTQVDAIISVGGYSFTSLVDTPNDWSSAAVGSWLVVGPDGRSVVTEPQSAGLQDGGQAVTTSNYGWSLHADNAAPRGLWHHNNHLWVVNDGTDTEVFVYTENGVLVNRLLCPDVGAPGGVFGHGDTLWLSDDAGDDLVAYTMPTIGGTVTKAPARKTSDDVAVTGLARLVSVTGTSTHLYAVGQLPNYTTRTRFLGYAYTSLSSLTRQFSIIGTGVGHDAAVDDDDLHYYVLANNKRDIWRALRSSLSQQELLFTTVIGGANATLNGIAHTPSTFWGVTAGGEMHAWDADTYDYLEPGEIRSATRVAQGLISTAEDELLDLGTLSDRDTAVTPANLAHWLTEQVATRSDSGFVTLGAVDTDYTGADDANPTTITQVMRALNEYNRITRPNLANTPGLRHLTTTATNFGDANAPGNAVLTPIAADDNDNIYVTMGRSISSFNGVWGNGRQQLGGNNLLPVAASRLVWHAGSLYALGTNNRLMVIDVAASPPTATYVGAFIAGGSVTQPVLASINDTLYAVSFSGGNELFVIDTTDGSGSKQSILHGGNYFGVSMTTPPVWVAFLEFHSHLWILNHNDSTWHRLTDDDLNVSALSRATVTMTDMPAGIEGATSYRGMLYFSQDVSNVKRYGRIV